MNDTASASAYLDIGIEGRLGVIALNRPQAINALSLDMVRAISRQLEAWEHDDRVRAVLFEGRGPRGFCSGGDVRAVRALVLEGRGEEAQLFFADEYRMNGAIAAYAKPVIALCEGAVMGGGIGIAGHADFRFASASARFAMPEAAIGFFCDVGVNAILARAPEHRALLFAMSGLPVAAGDALALGLSDCIVPSERLAEIRHGLVAASEAGDIETAVVALMGGENMDAGAAALCADADRLAPELGMPAAGEMVAGIAEAAADEPRLLGIAETLAGRCPTSLEAIVRSHRAARQLQDMAPILAQDLRLARLMSQRPDFLEGVRAVLLDKDGKPRWLPADHGSVPVAEIAAAIAAPATTDTPTRTRA